MLHAQNILVSVSEFIPMSVCLHPAMFSISTYPVDLPSCIFKVKRLFHDHIPGMAGCRQTDMGMSSNQTRGYFVHEACSKHFTGELH